MNNKDVQLSKKLSWILRHGAIREKISISPEGYVVIEELLKHPSFSGYTQSDIVRVVNTNTKQRYKIQLNSQTNKQEIKANQGHSIQVSDAQLTPILEAKYATVVHGTYMKFWPQIKLTGLSCMTRKHIHFAKGTLNDTTVISGIRNNVELYIFINLNAALKDGYKFYESENGVILTRGNAHGYLPLKYFKDVVKVSTGVSDTTLPHDLIKLFSKFGVLQVIKLHSGTAILHFNHALDARKLLQTQEYKLGSNTLLVKKMEPARVSKFLPKETRPETPKKSQQQHKKNRYIPADYADEIIQPTKIDLSGDFYNQMRNIMTNICLTNAEIDNTSLLYRQLEQMLQTQWPECKAYAFGSMTTGLAIKTSDADCYIALPRFVSEPGDPSNIVKARNVLAKRPEIFAELVAIPQASTPIVKFLHTPTKVRCDVSMKNCLSIRNSELIKYLLHTDDRLRDVALLLKYWGRVHALTGTGRLSNYALIMMYIFYLQQPHVSILPPVKVLRTYPVYVECWDTSFINNVILPNNLNNTSVPDLLGGFFQYYGAFNYKKYVICPYMGVPVERDLFHSGNLPEGFELYKDNVANNYCYPLKINSPMCVQDPFEQSRNVSTCVSQKFVAMLQKYFQFAADIYQREAPNDHVDFLRSLLQTKPRIITSKDVMCQVMIPTRFLLVPEFDENWRLRVRDVYESVFMKILKLNLTKQNEKCAKGRLHVTYKLSLTHCTWLGRQKHYEACKIEDPKSSFLELQEKVTERVLQENTKKLDSTIIIHLMTFTLNKVLTTYDLIVGEDYDDFKEFSSFMTKNLAVWCRELMKAGNLKKSTEQNNKSTAAAAALLKSVESKMTNDEKCVNDAAALLKAIDVNKTNNMVNGSANNRKSEVKKKPKKPKGVKASANRESGGTATWFCKSNDKSPTNNTLPAAACNGEAETVKPDVAAFLNNLANALKVSPSPNNVSLSVPNPSNTLSSFNTTAQYNTINSVSTASSSNSKDVAMTTSPTNTIETSITVTAAPSTQTINTSNPSSGTDLNVSKSLNAAPPSGYVPFNTFVKDMFANNGGPTKPMLTESKPTNNTNALANVANNHTLCNDISPAMNAENMINSLTSAPISATDINTADPKYSFPNISTVNPNNDDCTLKNKTDSIATAPKKDKVASVFKVARPPKSVHRNRTAASPVNMSTSRVSASRACTAADATAGIFNKATANGPASTNQYMCTINAKISPKNSPTKAIHMMSNT